MLRRLSSCRFRLLILPALAALLGPLGNDRGLAQIQGRTPAAPAPSTAERSPGSGPAVLRWRNGDELSGEILPGPEGLLRFAAAPFAAPFDLRPGQLSGLRFALADDPPDFPAAAGPGFEVTLKNGDRLSGQLRAINETEVAFSCPHFAAPLRIPRDAIIRLARIGGDGGAHSGLGEIEDWSSYGRDRKPTEWYADFRGELTTRQWSGNLFREIPLPEKVEVQFHARFPSGNPNLQVGLLREPSNGPMLETWDQNLVVTHRSRFAKVMSMGETTRELHLRLFWDQRSGKIEVRDPAGRLLASVSGETDPENPEPRRQLSDPLRRGFSILSRNPEIRLLALEVRPWDGKPVPVIDLSQPRIRLRGESTHLPAGAVTLEPGSERLRLGGAGRALDQLVEWVLSPESDRADAESASPPASLTRIAWSSGSSMSGRFVRLDGDGIALQPEWSAVPIEGPLSGVREIRFPENAEAIAGGSDQLKVSGTSLRGLVRLAGAGEPGDSTLLAWQPPGSERAVPFAEGASIEILRGTFAANAGDPPPTLGQARLYLETDEILTGTLVSIEPDRIVFESRITGRIEVDPVNVRAIDTGITGRFLDGFRDPEWEEFETAEEEITLTPESATLRGGTFGNPSIFLGDRVHFEADWKENYGAMTLRLFTSGPDSNHPSTDVVIAAQGNRLFIGKLNESGAVSFSGDQIPITNNRAVIDLTAEARSVAVRVNGKPALSVEIEPEKVSGNGIFFKMGGGWQGWNQAGSEIVIREFRVESSPGSVPARLIDPRAKANALAIPRTMRDRPPAHLLIAPNGDLLRGTLESVKAESVSFHANGASLVLPRARVSSIVRLRPPAPVPSETVSEPGKNASPAAIERDREGQAVDREEEAETPPDAPSQDEAHRRLLASYGFKVTHQLVLRDGTRLRLDGDGVEENRLTGTSAILGKCRVSLEQVHRIDRTPAKPMEEAVPLDPVAFHDWQPLLTPDPAIPEKGGPPMSPLVGKEAPDFTLSLLDDSTFSLAQHRGKVVVLDFWATWCGPCIKAMPEVMGAVSAFPPASVTFLAVNQAETPPLIRTFLETRQWQTTPVALDFNLKVSQSYQVDAIPHTVVIDPEGRIAWTHSGFSPDLKAKLFEAIAGLLTGAPRP
jgi:thiol-disulfide isomerase/thioredoxin